MKRKILFVCLGNICRSPAAEGVLKAAAEREGLSDKIVVDSAGTYGGHAGQLPDSRMRSAAARRGYDLTHRARQITEEDFIDFDMIVVMDDMNYESVSRLAPERRYLDKLYRFGVLRPPSAMEPCPRPILRRSRRIRTRARSSGGRLRRDSGKDSGRISRFRIA